MPDLIKFPATGPIVALIIPLTDTNGELSLPSPLNKWSFKNLTKDSGLFAPAKDIAAAANASNLEWETNDWAKYRLEITEQIFNAETNEEITADAESGTVPQIDIVTNNLPVDSEDTLADYADLLLAEDSLRDGTSLVVIGLGKGINSVTRNNIGVALVWGPKVSELKVKPDGKTPQTMLYSFKAQSKTLASAAETAMLGAGWLGSVTSDKGVAVTFPDITSAALTRLKAGKYAIIK